MFFRGNTCWFISHQRNKLRWFSSIIVALVDPFLRYHEHTTRPVDRGPSTDQGRWTEVLELCPVPCEVPAAEWIQRKHCLKWLKVRNWSTSAPVSLNDVKFSVCVWLVAERSLLSTKALLVPARRPFPWCTATHHEPEHPELCVNPIWCWYES